MAELVSGSWVPSVNSLARGGGRRVLACARLAQLHPQGSLMTSDVGLAWGTLLRHSCHLEGMAPWSCPGGSCCECWAQSEGSTQLLPHTLNIVFVENKQILLKGYGFHNAKSLNDIICRFRSGTMMVGKEPFNPADTTFHSTPALSQVLWFLWML